MARSTYLWRLNEVSPHIQSSEGINFLICPLGWSAFLHAFFAGFAQWQASPSVGACESNWLGIAVNLIASTVPGTDFSLVAMTNSIIERVTEFLSARCDIKHLVETSLSRDLVYGAEEFALCHEIAHVAAKDFHDPDELRADRWGLAAYVDSWELRPALYLDIASFDPIREVIGPFAFFIAVGSLLAVRALISQRLCRSDVDGSVLVWRQFANRSLESRRLVRSWLSACVTEQNRERVATELPRLNILINQLADYEKAFVDRLSLLSHDACTEAQEVARDTEQNEPDGL